MIIHRFASLGRRAWLVALTLFTTLLMPAVAFASGEHKAGGEANLQLPDLGATKMLGMDGRTLLASGLGVCLLGLIFGLVIFAQLRNLPVHKAMKDISELI